MKKDKELNESLEKMRIDNVLEGGVEDCKGETKSATSKLGSNERGIFGSRVEQIALRRSSDTITLFKAHGRAFRFPVGSIAVCVHDATSLSNNYSHEYVIQGIRVLTTPASLYPQDNRKINIRTCTQAHFIKEYLWYRRT